MLVSNQVKASATMRLGMLLVSLLAIIAFSILIGLIVFGAENNSAIGQALMEFLVVGRLPGTNIYFDLDSLIIAISLLIGIGSLVRVLIRVVNKRHVREYADRIGI